MLKKNKSMFLALCIAGWLIWCCLSSFDVLGIVVYIFLAAMTMIMLSGYLIHGKSRNDEKDGREEFFSERENFSNSQWFRFAIRVGRLYKAAIKTPGAQSLKRIFNNAKRIANEVDRDGSCESISMLWKYIYIFEEEEWKIERYIACFNTPNPGAKNLRVRACMEKRLAELADISDKLLDEVYGHELMEIIAGDDAIREILSGLDDGLKV